MLRPQPNEFTGEERLPSTRAGEAARRPSIKAKGSTAWGVSKAAEGCKHHRAGRQLGGGVLVLGTSFVQRKTPAVTGVVKAGGEGTAGGSGGKESGENSKGRS